MVTAGTRSNAIVTVYDMTSALKMLETKWNERVNTDKCFSHVKHPLNLNVGKIIGVIVPHQYQPGVISTAA